MEGQQLPEESLKSEAGVETYEVRSLAYIYAPRGDRRWALCRPASSKFFQMGIGEVVSLLLRMPTDLLVYVSPAPELML